MVVVVDTGLVVVVGFLVVLVDAGLVVGRLSDIPVLDPNLGSLVVVVERIPALGPIISG